MHIWADVLHVDDDGPNTWLKQGLVRKLREFNSLDGATSVQLIQGYNTQRDWLETLFPNYLKDLSKTLTVSTLLYV